MEGSANSHRDICRDGGSSRIDAQRCGAGAADTDSARERRNGQSPARGRPGGKEEGRGDDQCCRCLVPVTAAG